MFRLYTYVCSKCGYRGKAVNGLRRCIQCNELVIVRKVRRPLNQLNVMVRRIIFDDDDGIADTSEMADRSENGASNFAGDLKSALKIAQRLETKGFKFTSGVNQEGRLYACFSNKVNSFCAQSASMSVAICKAGIMACRPEI